MRTALALLSLVIASCNTASTVDRDWRIEVTTDGGFTGRGLGSIAITPDAVFANDPGRTCSGTLTEGERTDVERALSRQSAAWEPSYIEAGNPHGYADQVRYVLKVTRGSETMSTFWYDASAESLPNDAAEIFEAAWKVRQRVVSECR